MRNLNVKYLLPLFLIFLTVPNFAQNVENELMKKYSYLKQRYQNEYIVISSDVEHYGVNIPAIDKKIDPWGNETLRWSDGNSNFNNYIILLTTEIELLKRHGKDYYPSLTELLYAFIAIERLDLYSEYNLRVFWDDKILHEGDSTNSYIRYPADINGFMLRDDVSFGFWMTFHNHFGIEFGEPTEDFRKTNKYFSVFQKGIEPMQAMSQDNTIRMLEALAVCHTFMGKEYVGHIPVNYINRLIPDYLREKGIMSADSVDFALWAEDISARLIRNTQQPEEQAEMVFKPWKSLGHPEKNSLLSLISTRWYITNPIRKQPVAEGSGEDFGVYINAYGFGEAGKAITGRDEFHFENSDRGMLKWLFKVAVFKELRLPLGGAIQLPKNWDDVLPRTLASIADIDGWKEDVFFLLRDKRSKLTYEHMFMINYLMNMEELDEVYHSGCDIWQEDSAFMADLLLQAPLNGPFSDTSRAGYNVHWSTSSRVIWPTDIPNRRSGKNFEFAGLDYLVLHNLYRLVYGGEEYNLDYKPVRKRDVNGNNKYTREGMDGNKLYFKHAPVIMIKKN
jgi:hypothetical protein